MLARGLLSATVMVLWVGPASGGRVSPCLRAAVDTVDMNGTLVSHPLAADTVHEVGPPRHHVVPALYLVTDQPICAASQDRSVLIRDVRMVRLATDSSTNSALRRRLRERVSLRGVVTLVSGRDPRSPLLLTLVRTTTPPLKGRG
jgi:hypothetical protein